MKRNTCAACGYDDLEMFLDLGLSPIADAYTSEPSEVSPRHPLQVGVCTGCWLVQLLDVVDHHTLFGTGYSFYSSASPPLSAYHADYAADVMKDVGPLAKRLTVEIGCNDGDLLYHFAESGCSVLGVDPASGPVAVARDRGLDVLEESFGLKAATDIVAYHGTAGVVIANHVLAHVESVSDVVEGIAFLLDDDGVAFIEVQYLPDLLVNNAFDLVYHEHRNFFSLTSLETALNRWGLYVSKVDLTDRQGGSLRVCATKKPTSHHPDVDRLISREAWLRQAGVYRGFEGRVERIRDRLLDLIHNQFKGQCVIGYGAPAKATTLLNYCGLNANDISFVVDSTAAKQGRFIPGTGIPIVEPSEDALKRSDAALLNAWNYAPQIIRNNADYRGKWIVPIPAPIVL